MPLPPKKKQSHGRRSETMEEHASASNDINRDVWGVLNDVRADQQSLRQAHRDLREELLREIHRFALSRHALDPKVKCLVRQPSSIDFSSQLSAVSSVSTPRPCVAPQQMGMHHGPRCFEPLASVPQSGEPVPTSPQMLQGTRGAVEMQSHQHPTTSLDTLVPSSSGSDGVWTAEMGAPKLLNARARKQARRSALAGGKSLDFWEFRYSCWDVASLLGHRQSFQAMEASAIALLLSISMIVQSLLIIILFRLASTTLDDATIEGYKRWRTITGHAIDYMDYSTEESLASRVCSGDTSLHISNTQAVQVQNIDKYLRRHTPFNGPMMCILALLTWILTVSKEFHVLMSKLRACMNLPRGETVIAVQTNCLQLISLSLYRLIYIILLVTLRAIIAGGLLVAGVKFLIVTTAIQDILLNTVALEFILEFDELLFAAWAPRQTRMFVLWMNPLPVRGISWKGMDVDFFVIFSAVLGCLSIAISAWLLPEMQRMRSVEEALCGGLVDFSYSLSNANFVAWATANLHTSPDQVWQQSKGTSKYRLLRNIIENRYHSDIFALSTRAWGLQGAIWSVDAIHKQDIVGLALQVNRDCYDLIHGTLTQVGGVGPYVALMSLRDSLGNQSISSCEEVAMHCNTLLYSSVRMMCPKTCGCDSASSSLAFPFSHYGCPSTCLYKTNVVAALTAQPCVDQPKHVLVQDDSWQKLAFSYQQASAAMPTAYSNAWDHVAKLMPKIGCGVIEKALPMADFLDLCNGDWRPLQFWCPVACNCSLPKQRLTLCPSSC